MSSFMHALTILNFCHGESNRMHLRTIWFFSLLKHFFLSWFLSKRWRPPISIRYGFRSSSSTQQLGKPFYEAADEKVGCPTQQEKKLTLTKKQGQSRTKYRPEDKTQNFCTYENEKIVLFFFKISLFTSIRKVHRIQDYYRIWII